MKNQEIKLRVNLRQEIEKRKISQKQLSQELGIRQSTLHGYLLDLFPMGFKAL